MELVMIHDSQSYSVDQITMKIENSVYVESIK